MKRILLLATGICLLMTANAFAAKIDFTDPAFSPAQGAASFVSPMGGGITFNPGPIDPINSPVLWWDNLDGIGVQYSYEQDEIEGEEYLELIFTRTFLLDSIHISDLFIEHSYTEYGFYQLDNGAVQKFQAAADQNPGDVSDNGELIVDIGGALVTSITFTAPGLLFNQETQKMEDHEFAVKGITGTSTGTPVPIPPAVLLLGLGIVGLAGVRKKFKHSN